MKNWIVDPKEKALVLEPSGGFMASGCRHALRRKGGKPTACGGCYARATEALNAIEKTPRKAAQIVKAVFAAMRAESRK